MVSKASLLTIKASPYFTNAQPWLTAYATTQMSHKHATHTKIFKVLTLGITNVSSCSPGRLLDRSDEVLRLGAAATDWRRLDGSEPGVGLCETVTEEVGRQKLGKPGCCWGLVRWYTCL